MAHLLLRRLYAEAGLLARRAARLALLPVAVARPYVVSRRFQAYCVSMSKSGTHSIAGLFRGYRAAHEPQVDVLIFYLLKQGRAASLEQKRAFLRGRDRRLWLELESSHVLLDVVEALVAEFPQAKFILTIRNPYSWVESAINHWLTRRGPYYWSEFSRLRYGPRNTADAPEEWALRQYKLRSLDSYLSMWANHQRQILALIPPDRLIVIRTHELSQAIQRLAEFINIPAASLDRSQAHLFSAQQRVEIVSQIDTDYLNAKVAEHCGALMGQFFPEVHSLAEARQLESARLR